MVLVTDELSCLTPAFAEVWREAGAAWVVRSPNGLREGFTGRRLREVGEVFTAPGIRSVDDVDLGFLRPAPATAVQVMAVVSLRHQARAHDDLGRSDGRARQDRQRGRASQVWGAHEPAGNRWNREELTSFAQSQMPGPVLLVGVGKGLSVDADRAAYQRWDRGDHRGPSQPRRAQHGGVRRSSKSLDELPSQLAENAMPLVGLIMARPGRDGPAHSGLLAASADADGAADRASRGTRTGHLSRSDEAAVRRSCASAGRGSLACCSPWAAWGSRPGRCSMRS